MSTAEAYRDQLLLEATRIIKRWNDTNHVLHQGHIITLARDLAEGLPCPAEIIKSS